MVSGALLAAKQQLQEQQLAAGQSQQEIARQQEILQNPNLLRRYRLGYLLAPRYQQERLRLLGSLGEAQQQNLQQQQQLSQFELSQLVPAERTERAYETLNYEIKRTVDRYEGNYISASSINRIKEAFQHAGLNVQKAIDVYKKSSLGTGGSYAIRAPLSSPQGNIIATQYVSAGGSPNIPVVTPTGTSFGYTPPSLPGTPLEQIRLQSIPSEHINPIMSVVPASFSVYTPRTILAVSTNIAGKEISSFGSYIQSSLNEAKQEFESDFPYEIAIKTIPLPSAIPISLTIRKKITKEKAKEVLQKSSDEIIGSFIKGETGLPISEVAEFYPPIFATRLIGLGLQLGGNIFQRKVSVPSVSETKTNLFTFVKENPITTSLILGTVGYIGGKKGLEYLGKETLIKLPKIPPKAVESTDIKAFELEGERFLKGNFVVGQIQAPQKAIVINKAALLRTTAFRPNEVPTELLDYIYARKGKSIQLPKRFAEIPDLEQQLVLTFPTSRILESPARISLLIVPNLALGTGVKTGEIIGRYEKGKLIPEALGATIKASANRIEPIEIFKIEGKVTKTEETRKIFLKNLDSETSVAFQKLVQVYGYPANPSQFAKGEIITTSLGKITKQGAIIPAKLGKTINIQELTFLTQSKFLGEAEKEFGIVEIERLTERIAGQDITLPIVRQKVRPISLLSGETKVTTVRLTPQSSKIEFQRGFKPKLTPKQILQRQQELTSTTLVKGSLKLRNKLTSRKIQALPKTVVTTTFPKSTSAYAGLGLYERTAGGLLPSDLQQQGQISSEVSKSTSSFVSPTANVYIELVRTSQVGKEISKEITKDVTKEIAKEIPKEIAKEQTKQTTKTLLKELLKELPKTTTKETPLEIPRLSPRDEFFLISGKGKSRLRRKRTSKAYSVLLKRRGKYTPVYTGIPRGRALKFGSDLATRELSRQFKIVEAGVTESEDIAFRPSPKIFRTYKVRRGKQIPLSPDQFIQRISANLQTSEEKALIKQAKYFKRR